jgi:hypothetical protein
MNQKPWLGRETSGIFVVAMAVQITIRSGIAATRVTRPIRIRNPQMISKVPTRCSEVRMRKADLREAIHAHIGVDVLEDALREEDQAESQPNKQY